MDGNDEPRTGARGGAMRRVLVADDSESYRRITRGQLAAYGLHVIAVGSGSEALDRLAREPFDLLLVDGMMPGLDGPATAREIRRRELAAGLPRLPIVAITAGSQPEDRARMHEAGIDDLVVKPILEADLAQALARWLPSAGVPRAVVVPAPEPPPAPAPAPEATRSAMGVVDESAFARLSALGDAAFVARMVRLFLADAEGRVTQVEEAAAAGDVARLRVALGALESIASTVGATALGRRAHDLDDELRERHAVPAGAGVLPLAGDLAATRDRLHDLLGEMRSPAVR